MSINVGQIFVRHGRLGLAVRVVVEHLRQWQREVYSRLSRLEKEEQALEHHLQRRARRLAVLPPREGWLALVEGVRYTADAGLAQRLSESLGCLAVWMELQGGGLSWAAVHYEGGRPAGGRLEPVGGREARVRAAAREAGLAGLAVLESPAMPLYPPDAELGAWEHLRALGIPEEYIFVHPGEISRLGAGGEMEAGFVALQDSFYGGRLQATIGPARLAARPPGPPFRPDLVGLKDGQPASVREVRLLSGRPSRQALDSAFAAELNWRRRAFQVMSRTLPGTLPQVVFRYKDPGDPDARLDRELERRRAACRSPFVRLGQGGLLGRRGFAARAAEAINARRPEMAARPDERGDLEVRAGGDPAALPLDPAWRRYLAEPGSLDPLALEAAEAFAAGRAAGLRLDRRDRSRLLHLVAEAGAAPAGAVQQPLGGGLVKVLAVERGGRLVPVPAAALPGLGLTAAEALTAAAATLARVAAAVRIEAGDGPMTRLTSGPRLPVSSLLAWPGLAGRLAEVFGPDPCAAAPAAGVLLCGPAQAAQTPAFRAAVADEHALAPEPVSARVFRLTDHGPEACPG